MFVSTNAWRSCEPMCGLCSVAVCSTASTPARHSRTSSRSAIEPIAAVNGDARRSSPATSRPASRRTRTIASPRWPAEPVTRILLTRVTIARPRRADALCLNSPVTESAADKHAELRELLEASVREGDAAVSPADRALAFDRPDALPGARGRYCAQVALDGNGVTDADVAALRAEGLGDLEIFEYTVAAAVGAASRQLTSALTALARRRSPDS